MNFPPINLHVYVHNEDAADDRLVQKLKFKGTELEILIKRQKEKSNSANCKNNLLKL